jgi:hypothetical protein
MTVPWLGEFWKLIEHGPAVGPSDGVAEGTPDAAIPFGEEADALLAAWPGGITINDPGAGRIEGRTALLAFLASSRVWLEERAATTHTVATTLSPSRAVGEYEIELTQDGRRFDLPLAVAVEADRARRSLWIRIYHSQWPLLGHHELRSPLLATDPSVRESDVVGEYQAALAAGDTERIVATFEPDGCFREPAGPQYRRCGTETLRAFFAEFFSVGGGIILEHCTVTEDGVRTVLEFNAVRWGVHDMAPQAGIAVYERGTTGRIANARVYDDVSPPLD